MTEPDFPGQCYNAMEEVLEKSSTRFYLNPRVKVHSRVTLRIGASLGSKMQGQGCIFTLSRPFCGSNLPPSCEGYV